MSKQNFGSKNSGFTKFLVPKMFKCPKIWAKQKISIKKVKACKKLGPKRLVKIGSETAEIFLIWTNVALTNVARTNIIVIVGICLRWPQEPTFKVWSKSGQ